MSTVALIITCVAGTFAFAFLLSGYVGLLSQDQSELDDFNRRLERTQFRGSLAPIRRWQWMRREALPLSQVIAHWRARPQVRRLIWVGLLSLAITIISAWLTSTSR